MFCILPCAPIKDSFNLSPVGPAASLIPQMDKTRNELRKLSNTDHLITLISEGEVIMTRKVSFDNYLKAHVELMRSYVTTFTPCNFAYGCYFTPGDITTTGLTPRDQWALEIVMSRLNLSSIYQAGALNSMRVVFMETANSYRPGFKATADLVKNIQITYQYFSEGYQPVQRLLPYFDSIESLASTDAKGRYLELNKQMFEVYRNLLSINLAYLKIEKLRLLNEFKTCKEAAYAVYLRVLDSRTIMSQLSGKFKILPDISDFFNLAELFYQVLALYFLLVEHEDQKHKEELGFIKKEFQQMIYDNIVAIEEIERVMGTVGKLNHENDNTNYGLGVLKVIMEDVQRYFIPYSVSNIAMPLMCTRTKWRSQKFNR